MGTRAIFSQGLDWFVAGPALLWHLRCACQAPLADDALAVEVLEHASSLVRAQGVRVEDLKSSAYRLVRHTDEAAAYGRGVKRKKGDG